MKRGLFLSLAAWLAMSIGGAHAELPGKHPAYLHALADLRAARWLLAHRPGDAAVSAHEDIGIQRIDQAIGEIKRAAIDDGKDIRDHVGVDDTGDYRGRLHRAAGLLRKTRADVNREEDDPAARGLKHAALVHIDEAIRQTDAAIWDVEHHK